jgi:ubiquitin fusion degradation protein 1
MVAYNNKKYYIDIIESKPAAAISIIETDCEVDFAPPLDYKEPERLPPPPAPVAASSSQAAAPQVEEPKFSFFSGTGRRLDGKPAKHSTPSVPSVTSSTPSPAVTSSTAPRGPASTPVPATTSQRPAGKLVFGSGSGNGDSSTPKVQAPAPKKEEVKEEEKKQEGPKFQAFTGKSYSLRG